MAKQAKRSRDFVLSPTVDGTLEEVLASMVVVESAANPTRIKWTVSPTTYFHVVILDEEERWLLQTSVSGEIGFYISGYLVSKEPNDGNIHIVKGKQYYLYFRNQDVKVPFIIDGKI